MHVFVTGASGWVGSALVADLIQAGHQVSGLCRSGDKARALAAAGAQVVHGSLEDTPTLLQAASAADAVIHTAFNHDFSKFAENCEQDRRVIELLGGALQGSDRPLLVTSGLSGLKPGATERDLPAQTLRQSEVAARAVAERGVRAAAVRLPPSVHGIGDHGFVSVLIRIAREAGVSAWIGDGANAWSGAHRLDAARVFRLALEHMAQAHGEPVSVYHAVADEAVPFKRIAEVIGRHLDVPAQSRSPEHFGWFAMMAGADMSASSAATRKLLGWEPQQPDLLTDIARPEYYAP